MGNATANAWGLTVAGALVNRSGADQAQRAWLPSALERATTLQANHASSPRAARSSPASDNTNNAENDAAIDAVAKADARAAARCDTHCSWHAAVCTRGGDQATSSVRLSGKLRCGILSAVSGLGGDANSEAKAG